MILQIPSKLSYVYAIGNIDRNAWKDSHSPRIAVHEKFGSICERVMIVMLYNPRLIDSNDYNPNTRIKHQ
jgi:hypothetical protein